MIHPRALLCALCVSAVSLCFPARADDAPLPPEPLNWDIVSERCHSARAERAADRAFEASQIERTLEAARLGRVIGPKRNGRSWSGVDLTVRPCLFDTRERKRSELDRLAREAQSLRAEADELCGPESRWLPVINLWRHHTRPGAPEVGQIGIIESWSGDGDDRDDQNSLPLKVSHVRFDGSVLVQASAEFRYQTAGGATGMLSVEHRETRTIGWFVLSGMPGAANKTTGESLDAHGVWIVSGTTTFTTLDGGAVTTLVLERVCDRDTALTLLRAETIARAAKSAPPTEAPNPQPSAAPSNTEQPSAAQRDTDSSANSP